MLKYLLDTNIAIYVIKRRPIDVLEHFSRYAGQLCLSTLSQSELIHGVEKVQFPSGIFMLWKTSVHA